METRKEGYYWVKYHNDWHIGYCRPNEVQERLAWTLTAYIEDSWWFYDSDFDEIDENRIERKEPEVRIIKKFDLKEVSITPHGFEVGGNIKECEHCGGTKKRISYDDHCYDDEPCEYCC